MNVSTECLSEWTVTASPSLSQKDYDARDSLSFADEWQTTSSHWLGVSFRFDQVALDPARMKEGLAKTLYHIPALGARVMKDTDSGMSHLALLPIVEQDDENDDTQKQQGVQLEYYKGTSSLSNEELPNDSHARSVWKQAGLDAPGPGYSGGATLDSPLFRAKLVVFESQQVSYLCVGINHGICDGRGMCDILHVWSHFSSCNNAQEPLPPHLAERRVFGKRISEALKPATDTKELYQRMESELGTTHNPFSAETMASEILPHISRHEELEVRVSCSQLAALKEHVSKALDKGEWVSSFEVLCSSLLLAKWATFGAPPASGSHNLHVCCNLRGEDRSKRFSKDYFGNAAFDFREPIQTDVMSNESNSTIEYNMDSLVELAKRVHTAMRTGLADAETNACQTKDWFEAARHLGLQNKYDVWAPVIFDVLKGDGTFLNSWDKSWLDCSFVGDTGANPVKASSMVAWFGSLQNLMVEVPRHAETGDSTLYLAMSSDHAKRFRELCHDESMQKWIPFDIVPKP